MSRLSAGTGTTKKPPRRTAPVTDVQSGGGYRIPKRTVRPPAPSFGRPLAPSFPVQVSAPVRRPVPPVSLVPRASPKTIAATIRQGHAESMVKRAQQVHGAARRDVLAALGLGPQRVANSNDWYHPQPFPIVNPRIASIRDQTQATVMPANQHGVLGGLTARFASPNPASVYTGPGRWNGAAFSQQNIGKAMTRVIQHGRSTQKLGDIAFLHAAGIVNPYGTTTHPEHQAQLQAQRHQIEQAFLNRYRQLSKLNYGIGNTPLSDRQVLQQIRGASNDALLHALRTYKPSGLQASARRVQTEGLSLDPRAIVDALTTGLSGLGSVLQSGYGHNLVGNTLSDAAYLPIGAIGAGAMAASHPGEALKSVTSGVIGHLARGDVKGAEKYAQQHPGFAALELGGAATGVGRAVGAIGRSGVFGRRVFQTERAPIAHVNIPGTALYDRRSYSKDVFRQAGQRAFDKGVLRPGPMVKVGDRMVQSRLSPSRVHAEWRTRRFADYVASRANSRERVNRAEIAHQVLQAAPVRSHRGGKPGQAVGAWLDRTLASAPRYGESGVHWVARHLPDRFFRGERDVVTMVLEGVLRSRKTFQQDLKLERQRVENAYQAHLTGTSRMDKADVVANRQRAAAIDRVLNDPKALKNADGVFKSAERLAPLFRSLESEAIQRGALNPDSAARSKLFPTAQAHQGAVYGTSLTGPGGAHLSNWQIIDTFKAQGGNPELLTYLPHNLRLRGPAAFHQHFGQSRRSFEGSHSREGVQFARGASPSDYQHVIETAVGKSNVLGNIREYDHLLQTVGVRHADGRYLTAEEARRWIRNGVDDQGHPLPPGLVAKRAFNSRVSQDQLAKIEQQQGVNPAGAASLIEQHYRDRTVPTNDASKARNVVLIPATVDRRLAAHIGISGKGTATVQAAQGLFRRAVLPLSTKWMFGNFAEAVMRSATAGVVPGLDNYIGRRVIRSLIAYDSRAGKAAEAELIGGLNIGNRGLSNKRGPSLANVPVVNELATTIRLATDAGFAFNRAFEREFQYAGLGKFARQQVQELTGSWFKAMRVQRQAINDVARGLRDTPAQVQAARYLDQLLGQYSRFSPQVRGIVQTYTPFLPWYVNSLRFVYWTLPVHHTLKTALLTRVENQFQQDYKDQHNDKLTQSGDLATAVKAKDGGYLPLARYTPFGFAGPVAAGDLSPISSLFMPQIMGPILAGYGVDPFGQQIQIAKKYGGTGTPLQGGDLATVALNTLAESFIPGLSIARRIREGGQTALPTSTVLSPKTKGKESSHGQSALERIFLPWREIYLRNQTTGSVPKSVQNLIDKATQGLPANGGLPKDVQDMIDRALQGAKRP